jgi:hypothetical protein
VSAADQGWAGRFVPRGALPPASALPSLGERLAPFVTWQAGCWPRLAAAIEGLAAVRTRELRLGPRQFLAQINPGRVVNATAPVDAGSIQARPCFLCPGNLPPEEKGLAFGRHWVLLANPAPILPQHLVLAHREHRPQRVHDAIPALVELAVATAGHAACIYNGPACGASAPDHMHLQALAAGLLPEERAAWAVVDGAPAEAIIQRPRLKAWVVRAPGPVVLAFHGQPQAVAKALWAARDALGAVQGEPEEPRLNLLAVGRGGDLLALVFPRAAHRPACFFADEPHRVLVSPGSIDMAGLLVTVRHQDFERLDEALVESIYRETTMGPEPLALVLDLLTARLAHV